MTLQSGEENRQTEAHDVYKLNKPHPNQASPQISQQHVCSKRCSELQKRSAHAQRELWKKNLVIDHKLVATELLKP